MRESDFLRDENSSEGTVLRSMRGTVSGRGAMSSVTMAGAVEGCLHTMRVEGNAMTQGHPLGRCIGETTGDGRLREGGLHGLVLPPMGLRALRATS